MTDEQNPMSCPWLGDTSLATEADGSTLRRSGQSGKGAHERASTQPRNSEDSTQRGWPSTAHGRGLMGGGPLTKDEHAAAINDGRVVVAGSRRGPSGEGSGGGRRGSGCQQGEAPLTPKLLLLLYFEGNTCLVIETLKNCQ